MKVINLSILGFGFMGRVYNYASKVLSDFYPDAPKINIKTVLVSDRTNQEELKRRYGFDSVTVNLDEILNDNEIAAAYIGTPNDLHFDQSKKLISHDKHILCEKPLTVNLSQANDLKKFLDNKDKVLFNLVFEYRLIPAISKMKEIVSEGKLGNILQFRLAYLHGSYAEEREETWRLQPKTGGALVDLGPHVIDLVNFLIGPIESVSGKMVSVMPGRKVDDISWVLCRTENGVNGSIEVSRLSTGCTDDLRIEIHGTKGSLKWNLEDLNFFKFFSKLNQDDGYKTIPYFSHPKDGADFPPPKVSSGWLMAHIRTLYHFSKQITNPNYVDDRIATFEDGFMVQKIIEKVKKA